MKQHGLLQIILPAAACILSGCNASRNVPDVDWTLVPEEDAVTISDLAPYMEKIEIVRIADDDRLLFPCRTYRSLAAIPIIFVRRITVMFS